MTDTDFRRIEQDITTNKDIYEAFKKNYMNPNDYTFKSYFVDENLLNSIFAYMCLKDPEFVTEEKLTLLRKWVKKIRSLVLQ